MPSSSLVLRSRLVTAGLAFLFLYMSDIPLAAADAISWSVVETSCQSNSFVGCKIHDGQAPLLLPDTIGSITGSGTYTSGPLGEFSESGDFQASIAGFTFGSGSPAYCAFDDLDCSVHIGLTSTDAGVTGIFDLYSHSDISQVLLTFDGSTFGGTLGSDSIISGCGSFASCAVSGVLVPEPSSLSMLLIGLGMICGAVYLRRKNTLASRAISR